MRDVFVDLRPRVVYFGTVAAVDHRCVAVCVAQPVERALIRAHVAVRRRDHDGAGTDDHVAREERALAFEDEHEMIARMSRRVERQQRGVAGRHALALAERAIVGKGRVAMRVDRGARGARERRGAGE